MLKCTLQKQCLALAIQIFMKNPDESIHILNTQDLNMFLLSLSKHCFTVYACDEAENLIFKKTKTNNNCTWTKLLYKMPMSSQFGFVTRGAIWIYT